MTTLDRKPEDIPQNVWDAAQEANQIVFDASVDLYETGISATDGQVVIARAILDALSSLPAQAVGVKPAAVAITDEHIDEIIEESVIGGTDDYPAINRAGLIADLVLALDALHHGNAIAPPQPAAVGEAEIEAAARAINPVAFQVDPPHAKDSDAKRMMRAIARNQAQDALTAAALVHRDQVKL